MPTLRRLAATAAPPVAAGAALVMAPATAQAAPQASTAITLCSKGDFSSHLEVPALGQSTNLVQPGWCGVFEMAGHGVYQVNVLGGDQYIASFQWDSSRNVTVSTINAGGGKSFYLG
jgi:hypothetical protein